MVHWRTEKMELENKIKALESALDAIPETPPAPIQSPSPSPAPAPEMGPGPEMEGLVPPPQITASEIDQAVKAFESNRSKLNVTRPWEKKDVRKEWRRDIFKMERLDERRKEGFHQRFVSKNAIDKWLSRGYWVAQKEHYGKTWDNPLDMGSQVGNYIVRGECVLMETTMENKKAHDDAIEKQISQTKEDAKKRYKTEAEEIGVPTYEVKD